MHPKNQGAEANGHPLPTRMVSKLKSNTRSARRRLHKNKGKTRFFLITLNLAKNRITLLPRKSFGNLIGKTKR